MEQVKRNKKCHLQIKKTCCPKLYLLELASIWYIQ